MTEQIVKRGPGRPRLTPPGDAVKNEAAAAVNLVRVEITSDRHAFGEHGRKYWCGETPAVPEPLADQWVALGRARRL